MNRLYHHVHKLWLLGLLAKYQNFKEAAQTAGLTQSALSQSLSNLELAMGKTLVIRGRGTVQLTEFGKYLVERVRPILHSLDSLAGPGEQSEVKGNLTLGAYESIAVDYLPNLIKRLTQKYPALKIEVQTSRSAELCQKVRKGDLDLALIIGNEQDQKLDVDFLANEYLGLFVSSKHPIGAEGERALERGVVALSPGKEGHPLFYKRFVQKIPFDYQVRMTSDSFEAVRSITQSGLYVGLLPFRVANRVPGEFTRLWPANGQEGLGKHAMNLISRKSADQRIKAILLEQLEKDL